MAINLAGYLYSDNGTALTGADVTLIASDGSTENTTTTSSGLWTFSEADEDVYDIKIQSGSQIRYIKGADKLSVKEIDVRNNAGATTGSATFTNYAASTSNRVATFRSLNASRADNDEIYLSFNLQNSAGEDTEFARITAKATDVTDGEEDGQLEFQVLKSGSPVQAFTITSSTTGGQSIDFNQDAFTFGQGGDTDITLTFDANTADGVITWMEDEDYFAFSDDILLNTTEKLQLRDTAIYLYSSADGQADLVADSVIQVTAPTVNIEASTAITLESDSVTFGEAGDADIVLNFNANTADGVITWMEDEDYFKFSDEILMNSTEKILFGDTGTFIHQSSDGVLTIESDTTVDINGAVVFNGALSGITTISASGDVTLSGGGDGALQFTNAGENSIKIPDNQASGLIIEEANNAYITFDTRNSAEKITFAKALDIDAAVQIDSTVTVGVDDTGHDVKFFGAAAGAYMHWDEDANLLDIRGATAAGPGHLKLTTGELTVVNTDVLGRIDFQAPLESDSSADARLVGASIEAVAQDTFSNTSNATDIIFKTGHSETATEKFRFTSQGEIGIGGTNYGTDGQILTSGGAGAAAAWEDAGGSGTVQITALENIAAGQAVALVDSSGIKVESIHGLSESGETFDSYNYANLSAHGAQGGILYCAGINKFVHAFAINGAAGSNMWMRVGVWDTAKEQIKWYAPVEAISDAAYPRAVCWDEEHDRVVVVGATAGVDTKGWVFTVDTTNNTIYTSGDYAPGTAVTIHTSNPYYAQGIQLAFDDETDRIICFWQVYQTSGSDASKEGFLALLDVGGTNNTVLSVRSALQQCHTDTQGGSNNLMDKPTMMWNNYGTGHGMLIYEDESDSSYWKARAFTHDDGTDGSSFTLGTIIEPFGADNFGNIANTTGNSALGVNTNTQSFSNKPEGGGTYSIDTSNGNFIYGLYHYAGEANMTTHVFVALSVSGTTTTAGTPFVPRDTTLRGKGLSDYGGSGDWNSNFTDNSALTQARMPDTTIANVNNRVAGIMSIHYDPDLDVHVFVQHIDLYSISTKKFGGVDFPMQSSLVLGFGAFALGGTGDRTMTEAINPDWTPVFSRRGGVSNIGHMTTYANFTSLDLSYDTTNNIMHFALASDGGYSQNYNDFAFQRSYYWHFRKPSHATQTAANTYRASNSEHFIGFATAAATAAATCTVTVKGGINEAITGETLTVGKTYYLGDSGRLREQRMSASDNLYRAGIATHADKILVLGDKQEYVT